MNTEAFNFIRKHYAPARICLVGLSDPLYELIRMGQAKITPDHTRSKWNHAFLLGEQRGWFWWKRTYILESDFQFSFRETQFINGPRESLLQKWCTDSIQYACVLGMPLTTEEEQKVLAKASEIAHNKRYSYPVEGLFGTLWAILKHELTKKNIFNQKYEVQCATFVRMCYQSIDRDFITSGTHLSNTSPEEISQSSAFTFRQEWVK